jgi:hypothetical protein
MIRIPGSFNSKCILEGKDPEVRIIQRCNGYKPKINLLFRQFSCTSCRLENKRVTKAERTNKEIQKKYGNDTNDIKWIEILLDTSISDCRKNTISLILASYLMNV